MIDMCIRARNIVVAGISALMCVGALSACKTTEEYVKTYEVDLSETHIELPQTLLNNKDFKIKKVEIQELASYKAEVVHFNGGVYAYERYFRGGFHAASKKGLLEIVKKNYEGFNIIKEPDTVSGQMGNVYYTTIFNDTEGLTCVLGFGNYGSTVPFLNGSGYEARTMGRYCEKGRKADLDQSVLPWLQKIRLKS